MTDMTTLPTPAELREIDAFLHEDCVKIPRRHLAKLSNLRATLRQFATLIESAERGVTDEVVNDLWNDLVYPSFRQKLLAVAPHLALTHSLTPGYTVDAQALLQLRDFLSGAAPLDGVWFGDKHPNKSGQFWWRSHMKELLARAAELTQVTAQSVERASPATQQSQSWNCHLFQAIDGPRDSSVNPQNVAPVAGEGWRKAFQDWFAMAYTKRIGIGDGDWSWILDRVEHYRIASRRTEERDPEGSDKS